MDTPDLQSPPNSPENQPPAAADQPLAPLPQAIVSNQSTGLQKQQRNKRLRRRAALVVIAAFILVNLVVLLFTLVGKGSQDYNYVSNLSFLSSTIAYYLLAALFGGFLAYLAAHPVSLKPSNGAPAQAPELRPVNLLLVVGGFVLGIVPGLVWAFVISYPLSKHACELSGAKYC